MLWTFTYDLHSSNVILDTAYLSIEHRILLSKDKNILFLIFLERKCV